MTARQYADEVMLRLKAFDVASNLNTPFLMSCVNKAREETQKNFVKLYPECFGKISLLDVAETIETDFEIPDSYSSRDLQIITVTLPTDFIREQCVYLKYVISDVTYKVQLREVAKRELFNVSKSAWSGPTRRSPLYCIDRYNDVYRIYLGGLLDDTQSLFDDATGIQIELWHLAIINELEYPNAGGTIDAEITLPVLADELVILKSLLIALQETDNPSALDFIRENLRLMDSMVKDVYETELLKSTILLPTKEGI